ncbi:hypothetical protein DYB28_009098 [Aphanomyces astaci]|uniref:Transmembrane protein n=2 Tax=Aphanomyces astaci TaxID=112090 RepID=A0A9X8H9B2_APHAT|nr:hypothetical protein DYB28_009098 [Aphanomyces astaci]
MKAESSMRQRGGGVDKLHGWNKDFHSIHVGASTSLSSNKTHHVSNKKREFFSVQWIIAPLLLSWGVWNCYMAPHLLNVLAAFTIGALILLCMVSSATTSSTCNDDSCSDEDSMQLRIGINIVPSMNAWFASYLSPSSQDTLMSNELHPLRLHRSASTTSTFSSDSELEYTVRCSESTIAIDDDFDMYQDEVFEREDDGNDEGVLWTAPDALNSWMVASPVQCPLAPVLSQVAPSPVQVAPQVVKTPKVTEPSTSTKRKVREEATVASGRAVSTKRLIIATSRKRAPKSSLCRSPEIRRMMEELERMQDESDALVVAAESVGLGAKCTMNERLRRLHNA